MQFQTDISVAVMTQTGQTSSSFNYKWTYDVFLSFKGEDTRICFTGNLYNALNQKGIHTFIDHEELKRGDEITPALLKAIEESRIAIIVFSENYASSTFCLDELVKILEYVKEKGRLVWPIFYNIDPSKVRHQRGSFGDAMAKHEERFQDNKAKVQKWRVALWEAANLSGWDFNVVRHEYEYAFIGRIVKEVSIKVNRIPLHIADYPVGLECRVHKVNSLLGTAFGDQVRMVGIFGIGGIGKSTIARAVYNMIADQFECLCFLANIREKSIRDGIAQLQETLLSELIGETDTELGDANRGIPIVKCRLQRKKVLLVLDDVDKLEQLRAIAGGLDWFGPGSRIIITTRDKHLLDVHSVERTYEAKKLSNKESLELFSWNAFKRRTADTGYREISNRAVLCAHGRPLALEVMGSNLYGKKIDEWNAALDKYGRIPDERVQEVLNVSYNGLKEDEKEIFLDIACFFNGERLQYVKNILLHGRGFCPDYAIGVLFAKSLIKEVDGLVTMHDLIQDMGREIVRLESTLEPGARSRLFSSEDIVQVLEENMGTNKIEVIVLDLPKDEVQWNGKAFKKMKNLRVLIIKSASFSCGPKYLPNSLRVLDWREYPSPSLPSDFRPKKLVILNLHQSSFTWDKSLKECQHLTKMNFGGCKTLRQVPDMSGVPNLKRLYLHDCPNLIEIHDSLGHLDKLELLYAPDCINLRSFPCAIKLTSLILLDLSNCSSLQSFPEILGTMENLLSLKLNGTAVEELPFSIQNLIGLRCLKLLRCTRLTRLPTSIYMLPKLVSVEAESTRGLQVQFFNKCNGQEQELVSPMASSNMKSLLLSNCYFADGFLSKFLNCFLNVKRLQLSYSSFTILPACIKEYCFLSELYLDGCKQLREITGIPSTLKKLSARNCISLTTRSSSLLLSQTIHDAGDKDFLLPGTTIPKWFDLSGIATEPTFFWFRETLPPITVCVVLGAFNGHIPTIRFKIEVAINGLKIMDCSHDIQTLETDHIFLIDLSRHLDGYKNNFATTYVKHAWNHVMVSFDFRTSWSIIHVELDPSREEILKWGVQILHKNSMEHIRFTNPYPTMERLLRFPFYHF